MTSGERMVWAAEFVRCAATGARVSESAYRARCAVDCLRRAVDEPIDDDARAMVIDMLGVPR